MLPLTPDSETRSQHRGQWEVGRHVVLWSTPPQALFSGDGSWLVVSTTSAPLLWRWTFVSPLTTIFTFTFEDGHDVYFSFKCLMLCIILDNALSPDSKTYYVSRFHLHVVFVTFGLIITWQRNVMSAYFGAWFQTYFNLSWWEKHGRGMVQPAMVRPYGGDCFHLLVDFNQN